MASSASRVGLSWLRREIEVTRFLGAALTTTPASQLDPGPHLVDELAVTFWQRETLISAPDPAAAGRALAACHRALRSYPEDALPYLGFWDEALAVRDRVLAGALLTADEKRQVEHAFATSEGIVASIAGRTASLQAIHGDAHLGNALATERGVLWTDWEDAFVGPIEYDLASLASRRDLFGEDRVAIDAALAAYDGAHDASLVLDLGLVRNAQVIVWLTLFAERQPELMARVRQRIARLPT